MNTLARSGPRIDPSDPSAAAVAGFSLIELMVCTVIIATIASIAAPMLQSAEIATRERAVISTLRHIASAQRQVRVAAVIDSDTDGLGEYGFLQELAGTRMFRVDTDADGVADATGTQTFSPPPLSSSFGEVDATGCLERGGYLYRVYLPAADFDWTQEPGPGAVAVGVGARAAASCWACYAWPVNYGQTGFRAFFVNQSGRVLVCSNQDTGYDGLVHDPDKRAVLLPGGAGKMNSPVAIDIAGEDGNVWRVIE
ncbi:MAG: DUF2950 family protein [Planctomycetes bacterium]|nr:DUF2950 family protein [Planctomycetota bacterium]